MLVRLMYASRAKSSITTSLTDTILEQSKRNNSPIGVTGILCFSDDVFLQVLEGGRQAVTSLYSKIATDPRHHSLQLLSFKEIDERRFVNWRMGQVNLAKINTATLLKYSEQASVNPFSMSGDQCEALLNELITSAAISGR